MDHGPQKGAESCNLLSPLVGGSSAKGKQNNGSNEAHDPLIEMEPALAVLAVEACYYVCVSSGADGSAELRELLKAHDRLDAVDSVDDAAFGELARQWADGVRGAG
jgi:hypothetical protein